MRHTPSVFIAAALVAGTPLAAQANFIIDPHHIGAGSFAAGVMGGGERGFTTGIDFDRAGRSDHFKFDPHDDHPGHGDMRAAARVQTERHTFQMRGSSRDHGDHGFDGSWNLHAKLPHDFGNGPNRDSITAAVPEPSTYALMFAGLAGVALMARRRRQGRA